MRRLYEFTPQLSGLATLDAVAEGAASEIHASLGASGRGPAGAGDDLALAAAWPPEDALDAAAMTAARWAYSNRTGRADTGDAADHPVVLRAAATAKNPWRRSGVAKEPDGPPLDSEARALLDTLSEQTAAALDRASLAREMVSAKTATETERVRNTLLASVSHDFRTPLSSILGSATSLHRATATSSTPPRRRICLARSRHEAEGLDGMVRNLLAITRIDAGALELRHDWIDLREIVERVVSAARRRGARQRIEVDLPPDLPLVRADATLVEQAIGECGRAMRSRIRRPDRFVRSMPRSLPTRSRCTSPTTVRASRRSSAAHLREIRQGPDAPRADGGRAPGLALPSPRASWRRMAARSPPKARSRRGRGARFVLMFPREAPA